MHYHIQIQRIATLINLFNSHSLLEQLLELQLCLLGAVMRVQSPLDVPEPDRQYKRRRNKLEALAWECAAHLSICLSGLAPPFLSAALNAASLASLSLPAPRCRPLPFAAAVMTAQSALGFLTA